MSIETDVAILQVQYKRQQEEVSRLKDETLVKMQETLDKLENTMQRIQSIALGMGLYFLADSFGLSEAIKALLL